MTAPATIDSQDLSERLGSAAPPRVLDVRTPGEFETAHIAGAYNVPLDLLREHRDEIIKHLDEDVVLVCRSGQRAARPRRPCATPDWPTCTSSTAASPPGRPRVSRSTAARSAGTSSARCAWSPARSCCPAFWRSIAAPEAQVGGRRDRWRAGLRGADQHLRDGHGAVQAALQPRRHLRCPDHRVPARRFRPPDQKVS